MKFEEIGKQAVLALVIGITSGAALPAIYQETNFVNGWLASSAILAPAVFALMRAWACLGKGRAIVWMMATAFLLRLCLGVFFNFAFPAWGYDTPSQRAGYITQDAFRRDIEAVDLARSNQYLVTNFQQGFDTDQYGGMVLVSAWVYRYLSPDTHRSYLILILAAWIAALGIPFMQDVVRKTWGERVALWAGWIYVLYPDAVFFSSSQMREPFLIGLSAVAFWIVVHFNHRKWYCWAIILANIAGLFIFSTMAGLALSGFLCLWLWFDYFQKFTSTDSTGAKIRRLVSWLVILAVCGILVVTTFRWLQSSITWDSIVAKQESGWVARLIEGSPGWFQLIFITGYGLAQPVLPGVLVEPTIPLFRVIMLVRSLGWYLLIPLILYGVFAVYKERSSPHKTILILITVSLFTWLVISSARAGGDQWDNPRYRIIFMVWIAIFASWALNQGFTRRDPWLWRVILAELVFVGFFTNWYVSRYTRIWLRLPFWDMVFWIIGINAFIFLGGWIWDRFGLKYLKTRRSRNDKP